MNKENSKGWIIVRAMSGEKYVCKCSENLTQHDFTRPALLLNISELVTMNLPMPNGNISRRTMISDIDFSDGPREEMHVMISSWYKPTKEEKKWIEDELKEAQARTESAKKRAELMQKLEDGTLTEEEKKSVIKELTGMDPDEAGGRMVLPVTTLPPGVMPPGASPLGGMRR